MVKTNRPVRHAGGVNKDIRVKAKMLPAPKKSELVEAEVGPPRISKLNKKGMRSIFGDRADDILQLLECDETDSAVTLIYKRTLQSLVDLLPYAEHAVRKSKGARGVYQINSLISSMRELMTDIQSAQDRGMMGHALMNNVVKPAFSDMASDIVQEYSMIGADAKLGMTDKEWGRFQTSLKASRTRLANKITAHYRQVNDGTVAFLQR